MSTPQPQAIGIIWPGVEDLPVMVANQFLSQIGVGPDAQPEEVILCFGHVTPPILLGSPEEQAAAAGALQAVAVRPLARVALNRKRLQELIQVLQITAAKFDNPRGTGGAG